MKLLKESGLGTLSVTDGLSGVGPPPTLTMSQAFAIWMYPGAPLLSPRLTVTTVGRNRLGGTTRRRGGPVELLIVNVGGGPTPDKPSVTLSVPNPDSFSSFMNIRVADIHASYELWRSRGADFITEPMDKHGEACCYLRDPDGYIIEVGQSKPGFAYG